MKRKQVEEELEVLKKKRKTLQSVCDSLEADADKFAETAEDKSGTRMAELITKSNTMRKRMKDKRVEIRDLEQQLTEKIDELKHLP